MEVAIVGGGPAGLYAGQLLKKEHPAWDITVYERDPVDNTYGWGVVFSDATLGNLREADPITHERITDTFISWHPIDIYVEDHYFRCGGHTFAGIMRSDLLAILQERCRDVGVDLHHETTIDDPGALADDADLLIGADGLNSIVREEHEESFGPRIEHGSARFAWFGTDKPFDVFTFVFRENEHGLWRVHAYPGRKSTFIVECTEETWQSANLDELDEAEALAYFESLFDDHLRGHNLLAKLYSWRTFPVVSCRSWSHDDSVVLLGDAAHTAHFSIGSGTKLAMEDAIALMEGFREHGDDVGGALNWYEKERRPRVDALQGAAERSQRYFENVERYWNLPPRQFAYNLLTRSGRISYQSLKMRDPRFADAYDRWYRHTQVDGDVIAAGPPFVQPLTLGDVTYNNRIVLEVRQVNDGTKGMPGDTYREGFVDRGGRLPGMLLTDPVAVAPEGRITPATPGIYDDAHANAWGDAVDAIPDDVVAGIHLLHAGRRASMRDRRAGLDRPLPASDGWQPIAPSAKPFIPGGPAPTAMDDDACERVKGAYLEAADRSDAAGFDHLQLHMGHGYLLSSFLSPLTNDREDAYGGSFEARLRYPLEIVEAVRDRWPSSKALGVTLQATDWNLNGLTTRQSRDVARALADAGVDVISLVAGQATIRERPRFDPTVMVDFTEGMRNEVGIPAMSTAYLSTYDDVNTLVGAGRADLCLFPLSAIGDRDVRGI